MKTKGKWCRFVLEHSALPTRRLRSRLCLEILEDRLPPGDIVLGIGMALSSFGSDQPAGTAAVLRPRAFAGLNGDDTDDTANLSSVGEPGCVSARSTAVRLGHAPAVGEPTADLAALMAWQPTDDGRTVWRAARSNVNEASLLRDSSPAGPSSALVALDMPAALLASDSAGSRLWFLQAPVSNSRALSVSEQAPLAFDPASGWLAIWGQGSSDHIAETITTGGFLEVTLGSRPHSSDPASASFDPALAGANRDNLSGIRVEGGLGQEATPEHSGQTTPEQRGQVPLALTSQSLASGLTVQTDGAVDVTGAVQVQGPVAITAATISVHARLQGTTVDLASPGLVNVAAKGSVAAERIGVTAGVFIAAGQLHADGVHGGQIHVQAGNMLQGSRISADGTTADGGTVQLHFSGSYIATAAAVASANGVRGGQVTIDGGATGRLFSSGIQEAVGRSGSGTVALVGGRVIRADEADTSGQAHGSGFHLIDPHPTRSGTFGFQITPLSNGNVVVTNPHDNFVAPDSGAAYLMNGRTGALLGALVGSTAGDRVGDAGDPGGDGPLGPGPMGPVGDGVVALTNGNYVVLSSRWNGNRGAATWGDGMIGITGTVDASNSLVGANPGDQVGVQVAALSDGNYVVVSPDWNGGFPAGHGAATWGDGTVGITGTVDASNSLVGSNPGDRVGFAGFGFDGVTALSNGNYVVRSYLWNGERGAATWGNGTVGVTGTVDASNSLVGSNARDQVGSFGVTALSNGNYVVRSPFWNGNRGAATWGNGTIDVTGTVDASNSLVGSNADDQVGRAVTALGNGNYVVGSYLWNGNRGAATWGDGTLGITGTVDASNSLVGSNPNDRVGVVVAPLSNGNYVAYSPSWNGGRGAATWGNGTVGVTGTVDASNSLVGSNFNDVVGSLVRSLSNGNYVVGSPNWNGGRGAVTWGNGTIGVTGTVDASNSLVGSNASDHVGSGVAPLSNGNYVVGSPDWNAARGAATWGDGTIGITGTVDANNSLTGNNPGDHVGLGVAPLSNGNYVAYSPAWNGGRGAATWGNGTIGITGTVDASNSLVGSNADDQVGRAVTALGNGNYVVGSNLWNGNRGAATWGDGTLGITGTVDASNSLVGSNADDRVGVGVMALSNGNYVVYSPFWNGNRGAATWGNGTIGITGAVDTSNSLVGSNAFDEVGDGGVTALSNGNYVVRSPRWNGDRGAVTWGDGTMGTIGEVGDNNSLVG
jgi:hypothetical protein